jgi:hypothetical protein
MVMGLSWGIHKKGLFTTKSMNQHLERHLSGSNNKWIWKFKIPLKIKKFLLQLGKNAVLTRDNLKKKLA